MGPKESVVLTRFSLETRHTVTQQAHPSWHNSQRSYMETPQMQKLVKTLEQHFSKVWLATCLVGTWGMPQSAALAYKSSTRSSVEKTSRSVAAMVVMQQVLTNKLQP